WLIYAENASRRPRRSGAFGRSDLAKVSRRARAGIAERHNRPGILACALLHHQCQVGRISSSALASRRSRAFIFVMASIELLRVESPRSFLRVITRLRRRGTKRTF